MRQWTRGVWLVALVGCSGDPVAPAEPSAAAWARIEAAIAADQRVFDATPDGWVGSAHTVNGVFDATGARFDGRGASWRLDVRLAAIGREGGDTVALDGGRISTTGDRLTRSFPAVDEWWVDADVGFEHGFDVLVPPDGTGALRLVLETDGIAASETGDGLVFGSELAYRGLYAVDATGRELSAWFEPVTCDGPRCDVGIGVDVAGAAWPVTIDPMLTAAAATEASASNAVDRWYGRAVAVSADTIVVGAPGDPAAFSATGAVYVLERNQGGADAWGEVTRIAAPVGAVGFGSAVAIGANTMVVGAPGNPATNTGTAYVYERNGTWGAATALVPTTPATGDQFGASVAVYADTVLSVGAPGRGLDNGRVSTFADTGTWVLTGTLDGAAASRFGAAIAVADQWLVVGEPGAGTAGVFDVAEAPPTRIATLGAGDPTSALGSSVAIDAGRVVVGAPGTATAHLYGFDGVTWPELATLAPTADNGRYGLAVAIEDEAVAVADQLGVWVHEQNARGADTWLPASFSCPGDCGTPLAAPIGANGTGAGQIALADHVLVTGMPTADAAVGAVAIRRRTEDTWTVQREEVGAGTILDLGRSVSVDGDLMVVGAPDADPGGLVDAGTVYLFERNSGGAEQWGLAGQIDGAVAGHDFGWSVSLAGELLAVGDPDFGATGHVFTYERGAAGWTLLNDHVGVPNGELGYSVAVCLNRVLTGGPGTDLIRLIDPYTGTAQVRSNFVGRFGHSVACDDGRFLVGAPDADSAMGKAYLYTPGPFFPLLAATLTPSAPSVGAEFGTAVALTGRTALVGGPLDGTGGSVQVFRETNATTWTFQREIIGPVPLAGDQFGASLALDGDRLLVGAPGRGTDNGAMYVHTQNTGGSDVWGLLTTFDGANSGDELGTSVALVGGSMTTGMPAFSVGGIDEGAIRTWSSAMELPPTAIGDLATMMEDGLEISGDVLDNDFDGNGDSLTATPLSPPSNGTASLKVGGVWTYTPDPDFAGEDGFTYEIDDGTSVAIASLVITVTPVNDAPVAMPVAGVVAEDGALLVTLAATDVDGTIASYSITQASPDATHTAVVNGKLTVTPDPNFNGVLMLQYVAVDDLGAMSAPATLTITVSPVNDTPVAVNDGPFTVAEDLPYTLVFPGILANDTDVDGDALTVFDPTSIVASEGTVTVGPGGAITSWTRPQDFTGNATFTYQAVDPTGAKSSTATVTLNVTAVNDAPVATPLVGTMTEGVAKAFTLVGTDVDDATLTYAITTGSPSATTAIVGNQLTVTTIDPNFNGTLNLAFRATDPKGLPSAPAAITLTVTPVNDAPVAVVDTYEVLEDGQLVVSVAEGLLANDTDVDGDVLTVSAASTLTVLGGELAVSSDGSFTFVPDQDYDKSTGFSYQATDGTALALPKTVSITILPVNDPPLAIADSASTVEGTPVDIDALANDTDVELTPLVVVSATVVTGHGTATVVGSQVHWEPGLGIEADRTDPVVISYTISDGDLTATSTIDLTLTPVDDPPVPVADVFSANEDEVVTGNVLFNDFDVDSLLTATVVPGTEPTDGQFVFLNGEVSWTPPANFFGEVVFEYTVSDGTSVAGPVSVTLTVDPVNDAPLAVDDFAVAVEEEPVLVDVLANDTDVEGEALSLIGVVVEPAHGTYALLEGQIEWTPGPDRTDPTTLDYIVSDTSGGMGTATVHLSVTPVDDAPVPQPDTFVAQEGQPFEGSVLDNDVDVDSIPTVALLTGTNLGTVVLAPDGTFEWIRGDDFNGVDSFEYAISDATSTVGPVRVDLTVDPVNDAPRPEPDAFTGTEDLPLTENLAANDLDPEGDALTFTLFADATHGTVVIDPVTGDFTYTPFGDSWNGLDTFTYVASDGQLESGETLVELTILPADDAPVALDDFYDGDEDEDLILDVLANDLDIEGDALTPVLDAPPTFGTVTVNPDGTISWDPDLGFFGVDSFTYHVTANGLDSLPATVEITVLEIDDAPIGVADTFETPKDVILYGDVLSNDSDPNGDLLTATEDSKPANGTLVLLPSGSFNYTPLVGYVGTDSFTYVATGRGLSSPPVLVTIDVVEPRDTGETGLVETGDTATDGPIDTDLPNDTDCVPTTWYADNDSDTYGDSNRSQEACEAPVGYVAEAGDCNDIDPDINPDGTEVAGNDEDEDCTDGALYVVGESKGCGCGTGSSAPGLAVLFAALLAATRRRTR